MLQTMLTVDNTKQLYMFLASYDILIYDQELLHQPFV